MTENNDANDEPGKAPDNSGGANNAPADNGSTGGDETWYSGLQDADNRSTVEAKKWDSPDAAIKSYRDLEKHQNDLLKGPGPEATAEDWEKHNAKRGRPETPEGYELKLPENLPADMPYDADFATKFKNWSHKAGHTPREAQALHDEYVRDFAAQWVQGQEAENQTIETAHQNTIKAWGGDEQGEVYKRSTEMANRAIRQNGGEDLMQELVDFKLADRGVDGSLIMRTPLVAQLLAKVGQELYSEDRLFSSTGAVDNPWLDASENLAEQGRLVREDPQRAKALIVAAGLKPEMFRL